MDDKKIPASNRDQIATSSQELDIPVIDKEQLNMDNETTNQISTTEYCNEEVSLEGHQRTEQKIHEETALLNLRVILDDKDNEDLGLNIEKLRINETEEGDLEEDDILLTTDHSETQDFILNTSLTPTPEPDHTYSKKTSSSIFDDNDLVPGPYAAICSVCKKRFDDENLLNVHCTTHAEIKLKNIKSAFSEERTIKSNQGSRAIATGKSLKNHPIESENKSTVCSTCGFRFLYIDGYSRHVETHRDGNTSECERCGRNCMNSSNLSTHGLGCRYPDDDGQHICNKRGTIYSKRKFLLSHEGQQPGSNDCGKKLKKPKDLVNLHQAPSGKLPYRCDNCERCFPSLHRLRTHSRRCRFLGQHYSCGRCGINFIDGEHSGTRPGSRTGEECYTCEDCTESFLSLGALRRHRRLHELPSRQRNGKKYETNLTKYRNTNEHRDKSGTSSESD